MVLQDEKKYCFCPKYIRRRSKVHWEEPVIKRRLGQCSKMQRNLEGSTVDSLSLASHNKKGCKKIIEGAF
jgi:hypothetical protein